jgi:hypothetical protein
VIEIKAIFHFIPRIVTDFLTVYQKRIDCSRVLSPGILPGPSPNAPCWEDRKMTSRLPVKVGYSQREAGELTGLTAYRIGQLIQSDQLQTIRLGKSVLVSAASLQAFIARHRGHAPHSEAAAELAA